MSKFKALIVFMTFVIALCFNSFVFAAAGVNDSQAGSAVVPMWLPDKEAAVDQDKVIGRSIAPVWVSLGNRTVPSNHNPEGMLVEYGMDVASAKIHSSNKDRGFWLLKRTKARNEIELTYMRIAKDKSYYREVQKHIFFLDGTYKSAGRVDSKVNHPLKSSDIFYNAPEIMKDKTITKSNMDVPKLPDGFNRILPKKPRSLDLEKYNCFLDDRLTGLRYKGDKNYQMVTYAYNPADRVYYIGVAHVDRTGEREFNYTDGKIYLLTYENKILAEQDMKRAYLISDEEADKNARYKFEMRSK